MARVYFSNNRKNKFNAKKKHYNGRYYDSILEANYAEQLDWRTKLGEVIRWEPQYRFDLRINGSHWRYYKIDFRVELSDGFVEYVEVKGFPTPEWKQKWDVTKLVFKDLVKGENARLILNDKIEKQHYGREMEAD
ncbi:MAG: DUF1064 domain-containing protein [Bacteroidota bacterium]